MHPVLLTLPFPDVPLPLLPALLAVSLLGFGLSVYAHILRRTGLRTFGLASGVTAGAAGWAFRHQTLTLAKLEVPAYGTALGLALICGWGLTLRLASPPPRLERQLQDTLVVSAVCGLLASRASFVLVSSDRFPELEFLALRQGGLLGMGALLGGLLGAYLFCRQLALDFWQWLDWVAPGFVLGTALVRVGCYLNGCGYGVPLAENAPGWLSALGRFPRWQDPVDGPIEGSAAWLQQVVQGRLEPEATWTHPVHPVQLYEAVGALGLLLFAWLLTRRRLPTGQTGLAIVFGYVMLRFVVEAFRGDIERGLWGPSLHPAVLLGIGLLLFAAAFAYGPATSLPTGRVRIGALLACLVPAASFALLMRHHATPTQPSLSQWLALLAAGWTAHGWVQVTRKQRPTATFQKLTS